MVVRSLRKSDADTGWVFAPATTTGCGPGTRRSRPARHRARVVQDGRALHAAAARQGLRLPVVVKPRVVSRPGHREQRGPRVGPVGVYRLLARRRTLAGGGVRPARSPWSSTTAWDRWGCTASNLRAPGEHASSLRVVEKLGLEQVQSRLDSSTSTVPGATTRIFAITREECPEPVISRLGTHQSHQ